MAAKRVDGVQIERSADEILALKAGTLEAHALNQSAAAVYELCDGKTSTVGDGRRDSSPHRPSGR